VVFRELTRAGCTSAGFGFTQTREPLPTAHAACAWLECQTPAAQWMLQRALHYGHPTDPDKEPTAATLAEALKAQAFNRVISPMLNIPFAKSRTGTHP
jgi:hypothetical protein